MRLLGSVGTFAVRDLLNGWVISSVGRDSSQMGTEVLSIQGELKDWSVGNGDPLH